MERTITVPEFLLGLVVLFSFLTLVILVAVCTLSPHCLCYSCCPCGRHEKKNLKKKQAKISLADITPSFFWTTSTKFVQKEEKVLTLKDQLEKFSEQEALNPSLFRTYDSMLRLESDSDEENRSQGPTGTVHFTLEAEEDSETKNRLIYVVVKAVRDLQPRLYGGMSNLYLKLQLIAKNIKNPSLPGEVLDVQQSKVHERQDDTIFEETFIFRCSAEQSPDVMLKLMSFEYDKYSRHEWKGEAEVNLEDYDIQNKVSTLSEELRPPKQESNGEIMLSLSHLPTAGKLHVGILKWRGLNLREDPGASLYVKSVMIQGKNTLQKKKTKPKETTRETSLNEILIFDVRTEYSDKVGLIISLLQKPAAQSGRKDGGEKVIGSCCFGLAAQGPGQAHWNEMLQSPRKAIARWHVLR